MKRLSLTSVIFLFLVCVSHSAAKADPVRARILLGSREAVLSPAAVYDGGRVLAPLGILTSLGASYTTRSDDDSKVNVISESGQSGEVEFVDVSGTKMLPMDKVMSIIGGEQNWDSQTHTLTLLAQVKSIEFIDDTLKINCTFPVACTAGAWGGKAWVDIANSKLATETNEVYIGSSGITRARMAQFEPTTSRVALDLEKNLGYRVVSKPVASQIMLKFGENLPNQPKPAPKPQDNGIKPFKINEVRVEAFGNDRFDLVISTSAKGNVSLSYGVVPPAITLDMRRASLAVGANDIESSHPLLKRYNFGRFESGSGGVRLQLNLSRIVTYSVRVDESAITLSVRVPNRATGQLSGKLFAIDPGHGGSQKGAQAGGAVEKDVNLRIAKEVAAALEEAGAQVMLTRSGDDTMGLAARPEVAIYNKADFFLSFHCNSNGVSESATGIETYYHMQDGSARALAYAVHAGICAGTGMCDRRPRSDSALYSSGLAVLRRLENTDIPGILVECGYLNTASDRSRLLDSAYRKKLAQSVVAGLKAYIEGTPITY